MKNKQQMKLPSRDIIFGLVPEEKNRLNKKRGPVDRIKTGLGIAALL